MYQCDSCGEEGAAEFDKRLGYTLPDGWRRMDEDQDFCDVCLEADLEE